MMIRYLLRRLLQTVVLLFVVTLVVFAMIQAAPGGPSILLDPNMTEADAQAMRKAMGLDKPLHIQYGVWLWNLLHGDLGYSYTVSRPVLELILLKIPATLVLAMAAFFLSVGLGIPLGVISAIKRYSITDISVTAVSFFGLSVPVFWYGLMLIMLFSVKLQILPAGGMYEIGAQVTVWEILRHLALPAIVLGTVNMAQITRYTRSSFLTVMRMDYVRTARAKGLREILVLYKHAMRNALIPVITIIGLVFARFLGGAAVTETVFTWPGLGNLAVAAAYNRDYPIIMGITLIVSFLAIFSNLLVDILYMYIDPRVKYE
jgi:peptide/nickel transport system permease protein